MNTRHASQILFVSALSAFAASGTSLRAQKPERTASKECQQAATVLRAFDEAVVRSGGRAVEGDGKMKERDLAADQLTQCGAFGGIAAARTIRETRMLSDTATLRNLVSMFSNFRDTAVMNAAMSVAGDAAASVPARVYALRTIWGLRKGNGGIAYEQLLPWDEFQGEWSARCQIGVNVVDGHPFWSEGATPHPGFEEELRIFAQRLAYNRSQPVEVRTAAKCAMLP